MNRVWFLRVLVVAFIWVVVSRLTEIEALARAFLQARWEWLLAAGLIQGLYFLVFAAVYQSAFDTVGVRARIRHLLPVVFASIAVSVATRGIGGAVLFVDDASRRGESPGRTAVGMLLSLIADLTAFMLVLVPGVVVLLVFHALEPYEVVAAAILVAIVSALCGVMLVGLWRPGWVRSLLRGLQRMANAIGAKFHRAELVPSGWADRSSDEFANATSAMAAHPLRLVRTIGIALGAHILDLASLYLVALAFYGKIGIGPLVAGYAMAIVFWTVSITPQGIGVVEGGMTLVFASLGVPVEKATLIALGFRGLTFWLPMAAGFFVLRRLRSFTGDVETQTTLWGVRAAAILTGVTGLVNLISGIIPSLHDRMVVLESVLPLAVRHGARLAAVTAGLALLFLAIGLWRRKRAAWYLTLLALAVSLVSHLIKGLDYEEAALAALTGAWLVVLRSHYQTRSDPPSVRRGLVAAVVASGLALTYGAVGFYLLDRHFHVNFGFSAAVRQTLMMFAAYSDPGLQPITGYGRYFADSIYVVGALTMVYALVMLLRPVLLRASASADDRARAQGTVEQFGRSSLARFTLFPDKWYYFSPNGSIVAYAVKGRIALALGDPIGPERDAAPAIEGFQTLCVRNDWRAAFYQTLPDYLHHYRATGFLALHIGDEGIVDLGAFSIEGKEGKALRSAVNRLSRLNYRAVLHEPLLSDPFLEELRLVSNDWLTSMRGAEKGFSLGWFDDEYIRTGPVMVVHDPDGRVMAFANIIPEYQQNELTIDLMRRRASAPSGTMDFLFANLLQWGKDRGYATFNLGLSPLAGVGQQAGAPAVERALHFLYEHLNQFYNFKGLHTFKEKFRPRWFPRYLIYPDRASLPTVALAIIRADAGDRFLWDYVREFWQHHR